MTATAPGYPTATPTVTLVPSGFVINRSSGNFNTTTLSNADAASSSCRPG